MSMRAVLFVLLQSSEQTNKQTSYEIQMTKEAGRNPRKIAGQAISTPAGRSLNQFSRAETF